MAMKARPRRACRERRSWRVYPGRSRVGLEFPGPLRSDGLGKHRMHDLLLGSSTAPPRALSLTLSVRGTTVRRRRVGRPRLPVRGRSLPYAIVRGSHAASLPCSSLAFFPVRPAAVRGAFHLAHGGAAKRGRPNLPWAWRAGEAMAVGPGNWPGVAGMGGHRDETHPTRNAAAKGVRGRWLSPPRPGSAALSSRHGSTATSASVGSRVLPLAASSSASASFCSRSVARRELTRSSARCTGCQRGSWCPRRGISRVGYWYTTIAPSAPPQT